MDLKDLYRDVIVDHNRHPRNFGKLDPADARADGYNPLCGDQLTLYVNLDGDRMREMRKPVLAHSERRAGARSGVRFNRIAARRTD